MSGERAGVGKSVKSSTVNEDQTKRRAAILIEAGKKKKEEMAMEKRVVFLPKYDMDRAVSEIQRIILAWADTIHDFWAGLRLNKGQFNLAADEIKPVLLAMFRQTFQDGIVPIAGTAAQATQAVIDLIYTKLTEDAVAAPPGDKDPTKIKILLSEIEDTIRDYFEDFTETLRRPDPAASASHTDILAAVAGSPLDALTLREENDTFVVTQGTRRVKQFNEVEKIVIGNFILDFLFGNHDMPMVKMTCDTAPAKVATIFSSFTNVCACLTPQNFGDSATSSPDQVIGKGGTMYMFPTNVEYKDGRYEYAEDRTTFVSRRAVLTPQFTISYVNDGFDVKKPYGFKYVIRSETAGNAEFTFSSAERQGASLNYLLMAHLKMVELPDGSSAAAIRAALQTIPLQSGCLRVADINNDALLLEIFASVKANRSIWEELKRLGDQDQCDAGAYLYRMGEFVVLVTIDRPCFLLARLLGIPCILHNKDKLTLSKNRLAETPLTDEEKAAYKQAKIEKFVSNYTALYNALRGSVDFLTAFLGSIPDIAGVAWPKKRTGEPGAIIMKEVLRLRLEDIKQYITNILKTIYILGASFTAGRPLTEEEKAALPADFAAWPDLMSADPVETDEAKKLRTVQNEMYIRAVLNTFTDNGVDANALADIKRLIEAGEPFDITRDYDEFNFSLSDITELLSSYNTTVGAIQKNYRDDRPVDFIGILDQYNSYVGTVCEGFLNKVEGKRVESALVLPQSYPNPYTASTLNENALAVAQYEEAKLARRMYPGSDLPGISRLNSAITEAQRIAGGRFLVAQTFLKTQVQCVRNPDIAAPPTCVQAGGGMFDQVGGMEIISNVADLFTTICREAAAFVNQIYSAVDPAGFQHYIVKQFCNSIIFNRSVSHIMNSADAVRSVVTNPDTVTLVQRLAAHTAIPKLMDRLTQLQTRASQVRLAHEEALNIQEKIDELSLHIPGEAKQDPDTVIKSAVALRVSIPVNTVRSSDFIQYLALSEYDDFAFSLLTKWETGLELLNQETDGMDINAFIHQDDTVRSIGTATCIGVLLDPFTTKIAGSVPTREYRLLDLAAAHPFNRIPDRWDGATDEDIMKTVVPNMLVTFAFVNDILEGNVGADTSYFSHMILSGRPLPGPLSQYTLHTVGGWAGLSSILQTISWALTGERGLSPEALGLAVGRGGARRTRKNKAKGKRLTKRRR